MNQELDDKLCKAYPKIFAARHGKMETTAMCWGFECGDGWYTLIDSMCSLIQSHCNYSKECPQVIAFQIKEKFGGLRFYYDGGDDYIAGIVSFAEHMSQNICEVCGDRGVLNTEGWIKCLCPTHDKKD